GGTTTASRARRSARAGPSEANWGSFPAPSTFRWTATAGLYLPGSCYHSNVPGKRNLFGLDRAGLERVMAELGEPAYRARQLYVWLYRRHARSLEAMTDLGKGLRSRLESQSEIRWPAVASREHSRDGTIKYLFR